MSDSGFSIDWVWRQLGVIAFTWELRAHDSTALAEDARWRSALQLLEKAGS